MIQESSINGNSMVPNITSSMSQKDLDAEKVARTIRESLYRRYHVQTDTLSSLINLVLSNADHNASAVELKRSANEHINNIIKLNVYSRKNYNTCMELLWGRWCEFTLEQTIEDYITAWDEHGDFHLQTTAHYIYYNQDIWHNEAMEGYTNNDTERVPMYHK